MEEEQGEPERVEIKGGRGEKRRKKSTNAHKHKNALSVIFYCPCKDFERQTRKEVNMKNGSIFTDKHDQR